MKKYGIVSRTVHPTIPPTTEYQLTELGNELIPIMSAMDQWGKKYVRLYQEEQTQK
ncbi:winged helix-turn-helix transcriptional regulator [Blautia wexlerae]|uniref:winged helix-turn-helix transcriptional regulator n=1 Tax=Blautia TaxID=572511 RepID=UPI000E470F21|nr:winged helix-turn-helix transcriptional regulator [Blautia wexlerae]RHO11926.1 transcriptional regulator [Ruminococcus sp. AM18-44]RHO20901.1 transcriptional regulator [Ruminococcus sp. AM18-15]RHQ30827.1 transcriptional regulator [Ruminococcus sp. AF25-28AC]RHS57825.1 transcriptional regulator [Ruminococcus sp. AM45-9BH]RHS68947.1 transcriptional regulator [Ruminococcus sp. AM45-2]RHS72258.1 transcriptional regulator [Ruminococcus sp. AM44-9AT]